MPQDGPGREKVFAEYVLPEVEVLLRVAVTLTEDVADAEGLVRDTLERAYRAVDRYDEVRPRVWLLTLMRQAEDDRCRRRRPHTPRPPRVRLDRPTRTPPAEPPEAPAAGETWDEMVGVACAGLPAGHRQVVRLVDVDGLSYAEAAVLLGVPVGTVTGRLHRARKRIKGRLAAAGLVPGRGGR
ncbi:RNA polymerase sigma factor [Streptomyces halobius]|uniref:RNA polymerase sigma factor n=1 Tax=Streptomyces halobius TaxID=2879846 RepID=A0ABY4MI79_9ACTN|nr:RNA polymerase sigma factor [Streptomyces halobius]UQA97057.1 RNA polymerase sigma factor [Streptomyces halobius]